ncbi:MAG: metallophosphoesterase family protein [bacterium]|nr:metallophosphoesterase family protein [bacterium]MDT8364985.1 metallophosphoesterase family protein [bacterium]
MKVAVLADIHANLPALEAVQRDFSAEGIQTIWSLGDTVGYGAEPFACLQMLADLHAILITGNHEQAACDLAEASGFNSTAAQAIRWTRDTLTPDIRKNLYELPVNLSPQPGVFLFHGLPGNATGYLRTDETAQMVFDYLTDRDPRIRIAFFGHTHRPMIFTHLPGRPVHKFEPGEELVLAPGRRYLINPGSVGQPRNGDPKAQYTIFDTEQGIIFFKRVPYNISAAQERILQAGLSPSLAARLSQGI